MKFKLLLVAAVLACCCSNVHAQCTQLTYSKVGDNIINTSSAGYVYIQSETLTYLVQCTNNQTNTTFYQEKNATTAYGALGWPCPFLTACPPIACPPVWGLVVIPGELASFTAEAFNAYVQNNDSTSATCASQDAAQQIITTT